MPDPDTAIHETTHGLRHSVGWFEALNKKKGFDGDRLDIKPSFPPTPLHYYLYFYEFTTSMYLTGLFHIFKFLTSAVSVNSSSPPRQAICPSMASIMTTTTTTILRLVNTNNTNNNEVSHTLAKGAHSSVMVWRLSPLSFFLSTTHLLSFLQFPCCYCCPRRREINTVGLLTVARGSAFSHHIKWMTKMLTFSARSWKCTL